MADIKTEKPQPEVSDVADTAEAYTEKVTLSEHDLELEQALANYVPDSPEEKALVRKLDLYMGPTLWFMYILAYIDRQNIGNAKVAGMEADLKLTDDRKRPYTGPGKRSLSD
ncbi:allantoate permease [Colletotrichum lupini]|uniref:Allantoate permease n=1 Tax=Colletotrichum lupini TaxID=145971 RepID=A0A9Q8SDQ7_9PEZI|nr:allantoate permease [Colletotrichum lupini]UQC75496.1 allantoate permease [Colletotrichum lupini]